MFLKKKIKSVAVMFLVAVLIVLQIPDFSLVTKADTSGNIYYIDSVNGDDSFDGLSENTAWQSLSKVNSTEFSAGDRILFKSGCAFTGQLFPKGSGEENAPIVIDMYGNGPKPVIIADGLSNTIVTLYNQEYWEINNLEITSNNNTAIQYGVNFIAEDFGTVDHIYIKNCYIRDIAGSISSKITGGIFYTVKGTTVKTNFNDILVENNSLRTVNRTGITLDAYKSWNSKLIPEDQPGTWYPSTNVVIRGNFIDDIGGDGIVVKCCVGAIVEYNTAKNCNARSSEANVAIWTWNSNDCILQFNEAYNTRYTHDGEGFDVDSFCENTLVQYNYSHDNEGGFLLVCAPGEESASGYYTKDTTARYNISQNDGNLAIIYSGNIYNTDFYNNTIYVGEGIKSRVIDSWDWGGAWAQGGIFVNNLIYNLGDGEYDLGEIDIDINNNLFYGNHPESEPEDLNKITENPMLVAAGSGGIGLCSVDGYKLRGDSPALQRGIEVADCGTRDYYGNKINPSKPNIGAYGGEGVFEIYSNKYDTVDFEVLDYIHPVFVNSSPQSEVRMPDYVTARLTDGTDRFIKVIWNNEPLNFEITGSYKVNGLIYSDDGNCLEVFATVNVEAKEIGEILGAEWQYYNGNSSVYPDIEAGEYIEIVEDPANEEHGTVLRIGHEDYDTKLSLKLTKTTTETVAHKYEASVYLDGEMLNDSYILIKNEDAWESGAFSRAEIKDITSGKWIELNTENSKAGVEGLGGSTSKTIDCGYVTVDFVIKLAAGNYLYLDNLNLASGCTATYNKNIDTSKGDIIIYKNDFTVFNDFDVVNIQKPIEWNSWVGGKNESTFEDSVGYITEDGNTRLLIHNKNCGFTGSVIQNVLGIENGTYTVSVDCRTSGYSSAVIAVENYGGSKSQTPINIVSETMKTVTKNVKVTNNRIDITLYASGKADEYLILDNVTLKKEGEEKNLVLNGDFEADYSKTLLPEFKKNSAVKWDKWLNGTNPDTIFVADTGYMSNSSMAVMYDKAGSSNFNQTVTGLTPGKTYVVTAYVKLKGTGTAGMYCKNWGGTYSATIPNTDTWVKVFREVTVSAGKDRISVEFYCNAAAGDWFMVDNVSLFEKSNPSVNLLLNGSFECNIGDVDYDGKIVASDLLSMRKLLIENTDFYELAADVNDDSRIDVRDMVRLKKYLAGKDVVLGG